jgi:mannose-1-phosphate guanylyltransferase
MWEVADPTRYGIIGTDSQFRITRFLEKPKMEEAFSKWINAGAYVLEPDVFDLMEPDKVISIEREIFPILAEQGKLFGFKFYGFWIDAGTPSTYLVAQRILMDNMQIAENHYDHVKINEPVLIGKNCTFEKDSEIGPYVSLDDNITVQTGTVISNSVVLGNTKIGKNIRLDNVIVGYGCKIEDDVKMGSNVVIGDNQELNKGEEVTSNSKVGNE